MSQVTEQSARFQSFFFNDTATTEIYTLSLHDALPISDDPGAGDGRRVAADPRGASAGRGPGDGLARHVLPRAAQRPGARARRGGSARKGAAGDRTTTRPHPRPTPSPCAARRLTKRWTGRAPL